MNVLSDLSADKGALSAVEGGRQEVTVDRAVMCIIQQSRKPERLGVERSFNRCKVSANQISNIQGLFA